MKWLPLKYFYLDCLGELTKTAHIAIILIDATSAFATAELHYYLFCYIYFKPAN